MVSPDHPEVHRTDATGLQALLTLSPDAVVVADARGVVRHANERAATLFRTTVEVLVGRNIDRLLPADARAQHRADRHRFHQAPEARAMGSGRDLVALRSDGSRFPVDIALQPVRMRDELLVVAVVRDLSVQFALRERNQQLRDRADDLQEFIDLASHELRTPLTMVRGFAETLLHGRQQDPDHHRMLLERIVRNAARQEALIAGLLDLARLQRGALQLDPTLVQLDELVAEVVSLVQLPGALTVDVPGIAIYVDRLRVEQVLSNLLINASRYGAPPFGVQAQRTGEAVILCVSDAGDGVDATFERALFEAFRQESTGDRRVAQGLGLGLFLSRELMRAMGGQLHYRRDEQQRTSFDMVFPHRDAQVTSPPS